MPVREMQTQQNVLSALFNSEQRKDYTLQVVDRYVSHPQEGLDGTLHPALNLSSPFVKLDKDSHDFVARVQMEEGDEERAEQ